MIFKYQHQKNKSKPRFPRKKVPSVKVFFRKRKHQKKPGFLIGYFKAMFVLLKRKKRKKRITRPIYISRTKKLFSFFLSFKRSLTVFLLFVLLFVTYFQYSPSTQGATYTFTQTDWSGGATANNATHTSNQTGWNEYSAKDANLTTVNAGADLQLVSAPTVNEYTIGALANINVDATAVTDNSNGTWTITLGATDLSRIFKNDKFKDEASPQKSWKILSSFDSADKIIVWDSEGNGGAPSAAGATQATVGRWYNTLQAWEDARQGDLVTRNAIEKGVAYNDGTFTAGVTIDGSTTDSTHYMWLTVASTERHRGVASTGTLIQPDSAGDIILIKDPNVIIEWFDIDAITNSANAQRIINLAMTSSAESGFVELRNLILRNSYDDIISTYGNTSVANIDIIMKNIIAYGTRTNTSQIIFQYYNTVSIYNLTLYGGTGTGLNAYGSGTTSNVLVQNSLIFGTGLNFGGGNYHASSNYNLSSDASAPGVNSLPSRTLAQVAFKSTTAGSEDLHLEFNSVAKDAGTDLSTTFTTDIDQDTRTGTWDIGADDVGATLVKVHSIGTTGRDFSTLQAWEDARDGVLTTRQVFRATLQAAFTEGETVTNGTGGSGIYVKEEAVPKSSLKGTYDTLGSARGVYVSGSYAYVADDTAGLQIIDISNPAAPALTGTYNTPNNAEGVFVSGSYAYVADNLSGLQIINISNPAAPTLAGSYATASFANDVFISGNYAYVAVHTSGLQIIDISNPAAPILAGSYDTPDQAEGVFVSGNYAYVADNISGLQIIDISNPAAPTLAGTYNTSGNALGVYVSGNYAYVADDTAGLQIINISNPAAPALTGTYNTTGNAKNVFVSGSYAYVADDTAGLQIINISNPAAPALTGTYNTTGNADGVYVAGDYAYVGDKASGLQIIKPLEYFTLDNVTGVFVAGDTLTGGTSLSTATLSTILTTAGTIERGEAYKDSTFTAGVTIDNSTTDATHYMWLTAAPGSRHTGVAGTGVKVDLSTSSTINPINNYTKIHWLEVTGWPRWNSAVYASSGNSESAYLILHDAVSNGNSPAIRIYGGGTAFNNIIYKSGTDNSIGINTHNGSPANVYNNITYNNVKGINSEGSAAAKIIKNNISISNTTDYAGSFTTLSNNISSDATADDWGGTGNLISQTLSQAAFVSTTAGIEDFHLLPASVAKDAGTSLSTFTTDIDSQTRPVGSAWDIGADEYYPTYAYPSSQTLTSSGYDSTDTANVIGAFSWTEDSSLPTGAGVTVSLRTATSSANLASAGWSDFTNATTNCTKTTGVVTCPLAAIPAGLKDGTGDQWFQYKVTLTSTGANTPTFSDLTLQYVVNAPPQFDTSFNTTGTIATQNSDGTVTIQYQIRDPDTTTGTVTPNAITPSFEYSTNGGTGYSSITSTYLASTDLQNKTVGESSYTLYSATWNPKNQLGSSTYVTNAKIRVTLNDNEAANNTANAATANFTLDTTNPASPSVVISTNNNATAPGSTTLTLSATDNSSLQMKVGLASDLSDASWETYATSKTITLATDPDTVYAEFKDAYGNTSSIVSGTTPETPAGMMIQDTSNLNFSPAEYRLFAAWKVIALPAPGFAKYLVYRSTSPSSGFERIDNDTLTSRTVNYYGDSSVTFDTTYYYKVASLDSNNNISFLSDTIEAKANGAQDAEEGGGGSDGTGPVITNVTSSNPQTTSVTITWTTNELSNSTVGYSTDTSFTSEQGVSSYVTSHSVTLTNLTPNTNYKYQVKSTDPTGNLTTDNNSSAGYTFTTANGPSISNVTIKKVDNTEASITWQTDIDSDTSVTYGTTVSGGSIQSPVTSADTSLIGGSTPFTHTKTITNLTQDTTYYFSVSSTDSNNNTARDTNGGDFYSFLTTTDNTDPIISNIQASVTSDTEAVLTWTTNEPTKSTIQYGITSGGPYTSVSQTTYDTAHYAVISSLTADTKYYYKITATDINTNDTATVERTFTTGVNPEQDHDPLSEITDVSVPSSTLTDTQALITFTTDQPSLCLIESGTASGNYTNSLYYEDGYTEQENYNQRHSVIMNNLLFSTLYYYQITCMDNLDTAISSDEYSFTTAEQTETDTTAPDISKVKVKEITGETVTVTWETDEEGNSLVKYGIVSIEENMAGNATINSDADNYVEDHIVLVNSLIPSTKYKYAVVSIDASGNIAKSSEATFTTTSPSSLTSVKVLSKTLGEALISWKTSKDTTSIAEYGKDEDYGEKKENNNLIKEHELTISKLESGETYHFRVKGEDKDKNLYASNDYTFIPKSPPKIETQKTEKLEEHTVEIQFTTDIPTDALITYTNKDNPEETGSQGNPKNETSHIVTLKNLTPGTTYQTKIKARDTEGNESETDGPEFTTGKDENPPKIDQIRTDSALTQNDKVQTIISWTTDESADTALTYKEGRNGTEKDLKINDQFTTPHIAVLTSFKSGTVYYFKAKSTDQSGNTALSGEYALLTPKRKENIIQVIVNNFQEIFGWMR